MFFFVMKSGEMKKKVPSAQKLISFTAWKPQEARGLWSFGYQEARGLWPWASQGFQAVNLISFCTGGTSDISMCVVEVVAQHLILNSVRLLQLSSHDRFYLCWGWFRAHPLLIILYITKSLLNYCC